MIVSENPRPPLSEFRRLMMETDTYLNLDAQRREDYYVGRGGHALERDVFDAISECAKGTPFQGSLQLVSGASFPDIVAGKFYGVEVKSTAKNHWTSIGSSILESTRIENVERIFLTFGKLGRPVQFISRPYEECMSDIAVTHYPRYKIDMCLAPGETIFDKMGVPYDTLRRMENPVDPVSQYYRSRLKPGEQLWWAGEHVEEAAPATVRLWSALSLEEKRELTSMGYALFPELVAGDYKRYALWLVTAKGVVNTHVRDEFSGGGQVLMMTTKGIEVRMPATFGRIRRYKERIERIILETDEDTLKEHWGYLELPANRIWEWCNRIALSSKADVLLAIDVLHQVFNLG